LTAIYSISNLIICLRIIYNCISIAYLEESVGFFGQWFLWTSDYTNTYLKIYLGIVQAEQWTRITAEIREIEKLTEMGNQGDNKISLTRKLVRVYLTMIGIATFVCNMWVGYTVYLYEKLYKKCIGDGGDRKDCQEGDPDVVNATERSSDFYGISSAILLLIVTGTLIVSNWALVRYINKGELTQNAIM